MTQDNKSGGGEKKKTLTLGSKIAGKTTGSSDADPVRQSFSHGRTKTVQVEIKRRRSSSSDHGGGGGSKSTMGLTDDEVNSRLRALKNAITIQNAAAQEAIKRKSEDGGSDKNIALSDQPPSDATASFKEDTSKKFEKTTELKPPSPILSVDVPQPPVCAPLSPSLPLTKAPYQPRHHQRRPSVAETLENLQVVEYRSDEFNKPKPKPLVTPVGVAPVVARPVTPSRIYIPRAVTTPTRDNRDTTPRRADGVVGREGVTRSQPQQPYRNQGVGIGAATPRHRVLGSGGIPSIVTPSPLPGVGVNKPLVKNAFAEDDQSANARKKRVPLRQDAKKPVVRQRVPEGPKKLNHSVLSRVLSSASEEGSDTRRAALGMKVKRGKNKRSREVPEFQKVVREIIIPDFISVGELASRMAVRAPEIIKSLMKLGTMVTINQSIDSDMAELLCTEFGHTPKRVRDDAVEFHLVVNDNEEMLVSRPPIVTIMGHVDHGKTSLLDALRSTDVAGHEAGGITQHIGAYQVTLKNGKKITFIDTPGHAAFSQMRARGANVTDIVVLVVAADDGVKEQTLEALSHARAAGVPIVVAINKIDKPQSDAGRVKQELLQHSLVVEEYGGDVMAVDVSAKQRLGLDSLEEAILLQAEIMDLKANPNRRAQGIIIEAKMDKGRGNVVTVLIQHGTLVVGDIILAGTQWGRVRALIDDRGHKISKASPALPVEVLGFTGTPNAGDEFFVTEDEGKAREISEYRQRVYKESQIKVVPKTSIEAMLLKIAAGEANTLPVVIKSDVQGSLEAINASLLKLGNDEIRVKILFSGVGAISESDVSLAKASGGIILGFNVRANVQSKEMADRDKIDIRYYSIIYNLIDDIKLMLNGLLAPTRQEKYLGRVEIRQVFFISKIGKVAGCYVTDGLVKRGAKIRLLRDNVVIHEGDLKTLRRFKDEAKEVRESYECGIVFDGYNDIKVGDTVECFEIEEISRQIT